ncbi:uncharacterized protein LOC123517139 [Portunus trituberculatus]|uniref:uncharacterized protein LOC123517139 n=1 Tax=Portunus trituberculatus TaxID=210409 RepID=UPI001E1D0D24|nr:uncharacterized protein LOC123517139 [Portunus trituberculatus]
MPAMTCWDIDVSEPPRDAGASGLSAPPVTLQHVEMHWQPTRGCGATAGSTRHPAPPAKGDGVGVKGPPGLTFQQGRATSSSRPRQSSGELFGEVRKGSSHFPWKESVPNIGEIFEGVSAPYIV